MKNLFIITIMLTLYSCASSSISDGAKKVRVLNNSDAPAHCKELGQVESSAFSATENNRYNTLKEAANNIGGDLVVARRRSTYNVVYGTAYKCNN
ncbi:hypothetical protein KAR91_40875 [Candidatus Pacearchaeota archaeon]|nr:hypothetical protein [Candidatus Pacearchaeota archaeon]